MEKNGNCLSTKIIKTIKSIIKPIYINVRTAYYYGNNYNCPCCNKTFRKFRNFNYLEFDSKNEISLVI